MMDEGMLEESLHRETQMRNPIARPVVTRPAGLVFSARGRASFTAEQVRQLEAAMQVRFHAQLAPLPPARFVELAGEARILGLTRRAIRDLDAATLGAMPRLEGLAVYSTGHEWIDLEAAASLGIAVSFLPDYCTRTVAEHTLGLMLAMSRRIHLSHDKARGLVPEGTSLRGAELYGKTLGLIGFGRIGRLVARFAEAMGMRVCYCDPRAAQDDGFQARSLPDLLRASDVIVLTCSQQRGRPALLGREELRLVQPHALVINPARPGLVDDAAMIRALRDRAVAGYALDDRAPAYEDAGIEPGRILQTHHTAWYADEAMRRGTAAWIENLCSLAAGRGRCLLSPS